MLRHIALAVVLALAYAGSMAWVGFSTLSARATIPAWEGVAGLAAAGIAALLLAAGTRWRGDIVRAASRWFGEPSGAHAPLARATFLWILLAGCLVRLLWVGVFPASPSSDGATYLELAFKLVQGQPYEMADTRAYWPPGYPLFLSVWLMVFGDAKLALVSSNLVLFGVGLAGVGSIATQLMAARGRTVALWLFALWPNLITLAGLPEKELVLVALLPWVLRLSIATGRAATAGAATASSLTAGALLGFANLVQPALLLFPCVLMLYWAFQRRGPAWIVTVSLTLLVGAAVVILPWSARNLRVLGQFVLVSTNGGVGLYGANNPLAGGGYFEHWAQSDLPSMPELEADREGKRRAFQWIGENPGAFAALAFEKNLRFMGDDATGVFQTLRRGLPGSSTAQYGALKLLANAYWIAYWSLVLLTISAVWDRRDHLDATVLLLPASFFYSFGLHSLAESAGKYHILMSGILCVMLPALIHRLPLPVRFRHASAVPLAGTSPWRPS